MYTTAQQLSCPYYNKRRAYILGMINGDEGKREQTDTAGSGYNNATKIYMVQ